MAGWRSDVQWYGQCAHFLSKGILIAKKPAETELLLFSSPPPSEHAAIVVVNACACSGMEQEHIQIKTRVEAFSARDTAVAFWPALEQCKASLKGKCAGRRPERRRGPWSEGPPPAPRSRLRRVCALTPSLVNMCACTSRLYQRMDLISVNTTPLLFLHYRLLCSTKRPLSPAEKLLAKECLKPFNNNKYKRM